MNNQSNISSQRFTSDPPKKRKRGRPKSKNPRTIQYKIRLSEKENRHVKEAVPPGVNMSDFIRVEVLGLPPAAARKYPQDIQDLRFEISKIGTNLNQMTKALNEQPDKDKINIPAHILEKMVSDFYREIWSDYERILKASRTPYDDHAESLNNEFQKN